MQSRRNSGKPQDGEEPKGKEMLWREEQMVAQVGGGEAAAKQERRRRSRSGSSRNGIFAT